MGGCLSASSPPGQPAACGFSFGWWWLHGTKTGTAGYTVATRGKSDARIDKARYGLHSRLSLSGEAFKWWVLTGSNCRPTD